MRSVLLSVATAIFCQLLSIAGIICQIQQNII
jgi:hypothetical protein